MIPVDAKRESAESAHSTHQSRVCVRVGCLLLGFYAVTLDRGRDGTSDFAATRLAS